MTQRAPFRYLLLLALAASALAASGCTGQKELIARQQAELDSAHAAADELQASLRTVRDSLQFYDDIESGQYYRDRRLLADEIERLRYEIGLCMDGGRTVEVLLVDDLFEPASADLTDAGKRRLDDLAATLREEYAGRTLRVEGHSDSTPIGPGLADTFPSNWELSADRAAAVVHYLVDVSGLPSGQIALTAFGDARPVAKNDSAEGRRKNRRVRVAVMPN